MVDKNYYDRLDELIAALGPFTTLGEYEAWRVSVMNYVSTVLSTDSVYHDTIHRYLEDKFYTKNDANNVSTVVTSILVSLRDDMKNGMIASIVDKAVAETFDDFLDHADEYHKEGRKNESGVIAGVTYEDTVRRICRKHNIADSGKTLDPLINELAGQKHFSKNTAKAAKAAAGVRTSATHARWDEIELHQVRTTIDFTRRIILDHLEA